MTIKKKFLIMMAGIFITVFIATITLYNANSFLMEKSSDISEKQIIIINHAHELKLSVIQVQQWLTDISATRGLDGLNDGFDEAQNNANKFKSLINDLKQLDNEQAQRYQVLVPDFDAYYAVGKKMAQAYVDKGPAGGNQMMAEFDTVAEKISNEVNELLEDIKKNVNETAEIQSKAAKRAHFALVVSALLVISGLIFITFIMIQTLSRLPKSVDYLHKVAEGDLSETMKSSKNDEISQITIAAEKMRQNLIDILSEIRQSVDALSSVSGQVSESTEQSYIHIQQQQSHTEQLATAMTQMSASVAEINRNVSTTAQSSSQAEEAVLSGNKTLQTTSHLINSLASQITTAADSVNQLHEDSNEISSIVDVIKGIAEQTNLLALNAAIEAARAGEQGRGFAVVADEVRTLASRTQESTEEINQMINRLQSGAQGAASVMSQSRDQADEVVSQFKSAADSLAMIEQVITQINSMSNEIANATEEQKKVSDDASLSIVQISDMLKGITESINQTMNVTGNLGSLSATLKDMVNRFKF